jgi:hypothetical protein
MYDVLMKKDVLMLMSRNLGIHAQLWASLKPIANVRCADEKICNLGD